MPLLTPTGSKSSDTMGGSGGEGLLVDIEGVDHHGVTLVLQILQNWENGGALRRLGLQKRACFNANQLLHNQRIFRNGIHYTIAFQHLLNQLLVEEQSRLVVDEGPLRALLPY
ncbi:unnamed protein product [Lepeophtheirus salmonis]|uniref:(salmon louse) hypothetical protein n=1 Tax=Lepeophtheirus salmonis TaxID=72036 RepID=A0A7R8CN51_LEPSM|nr:unnamed protein product [Lepeophtheirus salmonis]CAF2827070.1 unnamed protein product [Lepeophtheirus salmonis]